MTRARLDARRVLTAAAVAAGAAAVLACLGSTADPDLPWHLAAGRRILATGAVPRADFLTWTREGAPWVDFEWAAQALFYALDRVGGVWGLWLFKAAASLSLAGLFAGLLRLWALPAEWIALAAASFAAGALTSSGLRPELLTMLFFMLQLQLLERRRLGRLPWGDGALLAFHVGLYAAWANLHAGFVTGLMLCACYGAGELAEPPAHRRRSSALLFAAAGLAATLVNPYGRGVYTVLREHAQHYDLLRRLIVEWSEPGFSNGFLRGYWLLLIFSFAGMIAAAAQGAAMPAAHLAAVLVFAPFASRAMRTTPYAALVLFPVGLLAWSRVKPPATRPLLRETLLASVCALVVVSGAVASDARGWPAAPVPVALQGPAGACAFLRAEKPALGRLRLFNPYNWGGFLDYALYPDYKPFMDGRYLFAGLLDETDEAGHSPDRWRRFMDEEGIELALVVNDGLMVRSPDDMAGRPFLASAMPRVDWALVYFDSQAAVLVRRKSAPFMWLAQHEYRWLRPHDLRQLGLYVMTGTAPLAEVDAEIDRYEREAGDRRQVLALRQWRENLVKGLTAAR